MRKKLPPKEKRDKIIGIKVKEKTREQLEYIAKREGQTLSTYIDIVLRKNIEQYFEIQKINWDKLPPEERRGGESWWKQ